MGTTQEAQVGTQQTNNASTSNAADSTKPGDKDTTHGTDHTVPNTHKTVTDHGVGPIPSPSAVPIMKKGKVPVTTGNSFSVLDTQSEEMSEGVESEAGEESCPGARTSKKSKKATGKQNPMEELIPPNTRRRTSSQKVGSKGSNT